LLLTGISDYACEFDFWRDAVRKVVYTQGGTRKDASAFLEKITDSLKIYGTRANDGDFMATITMARLLLKAEAGPAPSQGEAGGPVLKTVPGAASQAAALDQDRSFPCCAKRLIPLTRGAGSAVAINL
jgi:hypothetical protein